MKNKPCEKCRELEIDKMSDRIIKLMNTNGLGNRAVYQKLPRLLNMPEKYAEGNKSVAEIAIYMIDNKLDIPRIEPTVDVEVEQEDIETLVEILDEIRTDIAVELNNSLPEEDVIKYKKKFNAIQKLLSTLENPGMYKRINF